jgi:OmpA-OmpF porin, OOP family
MYFLYLPKYQNKTIIKTVFMASKKYSLLAGLLGLFVCSAAQAQSGSTTIYRGSGYDVLDTSLVPERRMDQQRDFLNRNYDYPAKPRNQWELGVGAGFLNVSGDVRSKSIFNKPLKGNALNTMAWNVSLRKAWGYVISTRLQYIQGAAHGYNWQPGQNHILQGSNPYWATQGAAGSATTSTSITPQAYGTDAVNVAYKTQQKELSLQMLAALNNIKFHRARNKMSTYGLFGVGGLWYNTFMDMLDANGAKYNFAAWQSPYTNTPGWTTGYRTARKAVETAMVAGMDGKFETRGERHDNRIYNGKNTFRPVATVGMGLQFKLGKRVSLGIEEKVTFTNDDLLDGYRWQEVNSTSGGQLSQSDMTRDFDNINYLSANLGINLGNKSVAPLWWLNPLDFAYNELTAPRRLRTGQAEPSPCDKDDDGDGISNCFDKCNDTPMGVAVDSKGCCLDTDGDGVCDYKDKQLITPTECQPVDADGIGKCPDPACCKNGVVPVTNCGSIMGGSCSFAPGTTKISGACMSNLGQLANQLKANPSCNVIVRGNGDGKLERQRSWVRASAVMNYLNSQGIDRDRIIFEFGGSGAANTVDYMSAPQGMRGGDIPPPPNPNLK